MIYLMSVGTGSPGSDFVIFLLNIVNSLHFEERSVSSTGR